MADDNNTTLAEFITDMGDISGAVLNVFQDVLQVFMEPPLVFFVGLGAFVSIAYMVKNMIKQT